MEKEIHLKKPNIVKYEQAYAVIGGQGVINIYDNEGNLVPNTTKRKFGKKEYIHHAEKKFFSEEEYTYVNEEVVYIGFMRGHWGHFMVDSSVRFWALERPECKGKRILLNIEGMNALYEKIFEYMGIEKSQIIVMSKTTKFKAVYVPELSYCPEQYVSKEYLYPFEKIANQINLQTPSFDKIYLSRLHFTKGKKELGEKDIQDIFLKNGYHVLYPEELSLEEQVWYYKNCKTMVTTNGTIAHNVLFCNAGTELIILNRFCEEENMHQKAINAIKNIKVNYIDAYHPHVEGTKNDSLMWKTKGLISFCNEKNYKMPKQLWGRKLYLRILFKLPYLYKFVK
ncbi:MAG: glycosyltransferase family 61 protein [Lachnospiraceae bacterium]|nr:glycosyltransferase family 61 protein [Lachnospiraceae bacterium]